MIPTETAFEIADRAARVAFAMSAAWIAGRWIFGVAHAVLIDDVDLAA